MPLTAPPTLSPELLRRHDVNGPRYTSYPTADRFHEAFTDTAYTTALAQRARGPAALARPLSVYVHIPFCASLCYYCACNKIITRRRERGEDYLGLLEQELDLQAAQLGRHSRVTQLHLGGGSPTFLDDAQLGRLMVMLHHRFDIDVGPGAECAIEVDPRTVDATRLQALRGMGFNRLSLGVQDFDPGVQQAVHRVQPFAQVAALMASARALGFDSVNFDLIYGLPRQTRTSFARTLDEVLQLRPDRIALYAYAHLPTRFKPQRRIHDAELPDAEAKLGMLSQSIAALLGAGYDYIGMDHFALPGDSLAIARRQGRLQRNFQGYSTQADCDLLGLGVSAIGRIGATYSQNARTLEEYADLLGQGRLPVVRGMALAQDDLLRRSVINALMCQGRVAFESIESAFLIDFRAHFANELDRLQTMAQEGLVDVDDQGITVTALGWYFVRAVAMVFDRYLQADRDRSRFSRIL